MANTPLHAGEVLAASAAGRAAADVRSLLFEIAWEVCAQVGGIYTVLRSKAPAAVRRWGDDYWLVGPYRESSAQIELEPHPAHGPVAEALEELARRGVRIHTGRWLVTGRPQVLLVDVASAAQRLGELKYFLWKDAGISTPDGDHEFNEIVALGAVVRDLLVAVEARAAGRPLLAHFHEWQGAAALPLLRRSPTRCATVFTTHATLVGRALSSANVDLYSQLRGIHGEWVARDHGFLPRHLLECAAAHAADVFTTVSEITGLEARQFLGRAPDALVPNGLNVERYAAPHEFQVRHQRNKQLIHEFVMGHFFPSYTFDLDRTLYVFTAGRYEFRNKGLDVFIEALYELNRRMKAQPTGATVVAFIVTRAACRGPNVVTLNRQAMFHELRETCDAIKEDMGERLFRVLATGSLPTIDDLIDEYASVRLKRMRHAWRQGPPPTIVTHDLVDDAHDPVLCHLRHRGLLNAPDDPVKVVFHPEFITSASPILGLEYDQFVRGCHLGVFPSYYEPWGYTPMECVVRGIPAITSDLSGFGAYVDEHFPAHDQDGLYVARRRHVDFATTVRQIVDWLEQLTRMTRRDRVNLRNRVESHAEHFDWSQMDRCYEAARELALRKRYPEQPSAIETPPNPPAPATPPAPAVRTHSASERPRRRASRKP